VLCFFCTVSKTSVCIFVAHFVTFRLRSTWLSYCWPTTSCRQARFRPTPRRHFSSIGHAVTNRPATHLQRSPSFSHYLSAITLLARFLYPRYYSALTSVLLNKCTVQMSRSHLCGITLAFSPIFGDGRLKEYVGTKHIQIFV
jgi:hypothetical protein